MKIKILKTILLIITLGSFSAHSSELNVSDVVSLFEGRLDMSLDYNDYKIKEDFIILEKPNIYIGASNSKDLNFIKEEIKISTEKVSMYSFGGKEIIKIKNAILKKDNLNYSFVDGLMSKDEYLINLKYYKSSDEDFEIKFEIEIEGFIYLKIYSNKYSKKNKVKVSNDVYRNRKVGYYKNFNIDLNTYFGLGKLNNLYKIGFFDTYSKILNKEIVNKFESSIIKNKNLELSLELMKEKKIEDISFVIMGIIYILSNINDLDLEDDNIDIIEELYNNDDINLKINFN